MMMKVFRDELQENVPVASQSLKQSEDIGKYAEGLTYAS